MKIDQNDLFDANQKNFIKSISVAKFGAAPNEERKVDPKKPSISHRQMPFQQPANFLGYDIQNMSGNNHVKSAKFLHQPNNSIINNNQTNRNPNHH